MKMFMDGPNWTKAVIGLVLLAVAGVAGAKEVRYKGTAHCFTTEDRKGEICIERIPGRAWDCKESPLGWDDCTPIQITPGGRSSCTHDQCRDFSASMCSGGVFMMAFYPYARGEEISCIAMCRGSGLHEDTCGGMGGSSPSEPPSGVCGECPGACSLEDDCCYPDCPEDQIPL